MGKNHDAKIEITKWIWGFELRNLRSAFMKICKTNSNKLQLKLVQTKGIPFKKRQLVIKWIYKNRTNIKKFEQKNFAAYLYPTSIFVPSFLLTIFYLHFLFFKLYVSQKNCKFVQSVA
jgi:hypothetical protein